MARISEKFSLWRSHKHTARPELITALGAHAGLMIASAVRVLGSLHDAEDIAQDIAERLLRSPPIDIRNWPAYLRTMAVNGALDRLRKRRSTEGVEDIVDDSTPESLFEATERGAALRGAIATLSNKDALLFSLYYLEELSQAEIGEQLDMTENAVAVALHRVRQRLCNDLRDRLQINNEEQ